MKEKKTKNVFSESGLAPSESHRGPGGGAAAAEGAGGGEAEGRGGEGGEAAGGGEGGDAAAVRGGRAEEQGEGEGTPAHAD